MESQTASIPHPEQFPDSEKLPLIPGSPCNFRKSVSSILFVLGLLLTTEASKKAQHGQNPGLGKVNVDLYFWKVLLYVAPTIIRTHSI